jgi:hypothetical protein
MHGTSLILDRIFNTGGVGSPCRQHVTVAPKTLASTSPVEAIRGLADLGSD